jgi:hypothetical protein
VVKWDASPELHDTVYVRLIEMPAPIEVPVHATG